MHFSIYTYFPSRFFIFDWKKSGLKQRLLKWCGFAILGSGLAYLYYSILRLSPFFHIIDEKNLTFVYPLREWLQHPFTFFWGNLLGQWSWLHTYMTPLILVLILISFFWGKEFIREKLLALIWFGVPFIFLAFFGKVLYPRFIFFMTLPLVPLMADVVVRLSTQIKKKWIVAVICILVFAKPVFVDYQILFDFSHALIPTSDRNQYSNDWPAGGGVKEAIQYFQQQAQNGKIYIATEGTYGLLPYAFEMYLESNQNIKIQGYWPMQYPVFTQLLDISKKMPTYFVFYQPCTDCPDPGLAPTTWPMKLVYQYKKPNPYRYFSIYQVER